MIGLDMGLVVAVLIALLVFGIVYNSFITWAERRKYLEGFTWLAVAIGVAITLGGVAVIDWRCALLVLVAFCFSGAPMAAGALWRYISLREKGQAYDAQASRVAE